MGVKFVTDSTCYMPDELVKEYDIEVVSLSVCFEDECYKETQIDNDTFYSKMNKLGIPTSSQPSLNEMKSLFEGIISNGDSVIAVFMSSELSGTYSSSLLARDMVLENYPDAKIGIIDSRSTCMEMGFAIIEAAKLAKAGKDFETVFNSVLNIMKRSRFIFVPDTLEYLKKGGRIGNAAALLGSILQIKPLLTVMDGKATVLGKVRTKKIAIQKMIDIFLDDISKYGMGDVIVHHISNEIEGLEISKKIEDVIKKTVSICPIGPVIGLHVGPGSVGIAYYTNKDSN